MVSNWGELPHVTYSTNGEGIECYEQSQSISYLGIELVSIVYGVLGFNS